MSNLTEKTVAELKALTIQAIARKDVGLLDKIKVETKRRAQPHIEKGHQKLASLVTKF